MRTELWAAPGLVSVGALYDHETRRFATPLQRYNFPLKPGESWNQWVDNVNESAQSQGAINRYVAVDGWERVATPAGSFDAIRLRVLMRLDDGEFCAGRPRAATSCGTHRTRGRSCVPSATRSSSNWTGPTPRRSIRSTRVWSCAPLRRAHSPALLRLSRARARPRPRGSGRRGRLRGRRNVAASSPIAFIDRRTRPLSSVSSTLTFTTWPSFRWSDTLLTRSLAICEMCSRPSLPGQNLHDRAEIEQPEHRAFVDLADFDFGGDVLDALLAPASPASALTEAMVILPSSSMSIVRAGFFGQRADHRAALADHVADLLGIDLDGDHARRVSRRLRCARAASLPS